MTQIQNSSAPLIFDWAQLSATQQTRKAWFGGLPFAARKSGLTDWLNDLAYNLTTWAATGFGRVCLTVAGLYLLFGTAFNFSAPFRLALAMIMFVFRHPAADWFMFRVLCIMALILWLMCIGEMIQERFKLKTEAGELIDADPAADHGNGFGRYAIEDFREQSPFGDANLARKREIARALVGQAVTHTPKFGE